MRDKQRLGADDSPGAEGPWSPRLPLVVLPLLALLLNWPYLQSGFQADDYIFINALTDGVPFSRWRGFWSIDTPDCFTKLWWLEPSFERGFFRPLPSLVFEGSLLLFGQVAFPLHLLSILLHGAVACLVYALLRRLTGRVGFAALAALIFVVCEDHSMGIGWIAAMTDLLGVALIMVALWAHVLWLQTRRPMALVSSLLSTMLALGCKETAAITPALMILLTGLLPTGSALEEQVARPLKKRLSAALRDPWSWAPSLGLLGAFLALYQGLHLGGMNNLMYISPFASPGAYFEHLVGHLPVMWLATVSPARPAIVMFFPAALGAMAIAGTVAFALWVAALWPLRRNVLVQWAFAAYLVTLLPQMGTDASERGLYLPMIPASCLLAMLLERIGPVARRLGVPREKLPALTRGFGWWVLVGPVILGTLVSIASPFMFRLSLNQPELATRTMVPFVKAQQPTHIVLLNTSGMLMTFYPGELLAHQLGQRKDVRVLSSGHGVWTVERVGPQAFVLRTDRAGWLANLFARFVRVEARLEPGRRYETDLFTATLLELTPAELDVLAVRFDMKLPLDSPELLVLGWNGTSFEPVHLASAPLRERRLLADTSNPFAGMR